MQRLFLSTAVDYVNSAPHVGHALEKIQTDTIARYYRLLGEEVFFLTGTDENSLKNVQAARREDIPVKKLVDRNSKKFYGLKKALNLSFDDFIRTTEKRHVRGVQKLWLACQKDIYKKTYKGLYCVGCEEFYKESELENGLCPEHKTKPELIEEENYFFRLSKYQNELRKIIEVDEIKIVPKTRKNEILSFISQGLEDICISRSAERAQEWGIDVPGDKTQKIWVWFDALSNYINALGYEESSAKFQEFWQNNKNKVHIIGKGILRFHTIYWPAFLLSADISLPNNIFVHGYVTSNGQKMSKSLGNVIDPFELVKKYGTDAVRYFLLAEIPPTEDGDFTYEKFEKRYNSDLANGIGNLIARTTALAEKFWRGVVPLIDTEKAGNAWVFPLLLKPPQSGNYTFKSHTEFLSQGVNYNFSDFKFKEVLIYIFGAIGGLDKSINDYALYNPSEKFKNDQPGLNEKLYAILEELRIISYVLSPFLPETADRIFEQLGLNPKKEKDKTFKKAIEWGGLQSGTKIKKGKPLFPKV